MRSQSNLLQVPVGMVAHSDEPCVWESVGTSQFSMSVSSSRHMRQCLGWEPRPFRGHSYKVCRSQESHQQVTRMAKPSRTQGRGWEAGVPGTIVCRKWQAYVKCRNEGSRCGRGD